MNDKKLEKLKKILGKDTVSELDGTDPVLLKAVIVDAERSMQYVEEELEANPKYQELKESLSALTQGKKEVNKRQRAIIAYCLSRL